MDKSDKIPNKDKSKDNRRQKKKRAVDDKQRLVSTFLKTLEREDDELRICSDSEISDALRSRSHSGNIYETTLNVSTGVVKHRVKPSQNRGIVRKLSIQTMEAMDPIEEQSKGVIPQRQTMGVNSMVAHNQLIATKGVNSVFEDGKNESDNDNSTSMDKGDYLSSNEMFTGTDDNTIQWRIQDFPEGGA